MHRSGSRARVRVLAVPRRRLDVMHKVVFINGQKEWIAEAFRQRAPSEDFQVEWRRFDAAEEEKLPVVRDAEFLVLHPAEISPDLLRRAGKLRLLQLLTAGYDRIDLGLTSELGVPVATNGGANAWAVAEHTVALLLALYKRLIHADRGCREGVWRKGVEGYPAYEVAGKTLGLVGAGRIGRKVARRLAAFECSILYYDIVQAPDIEKDLGAKRVSLEELLRRADIISLHVPGTAETHKLINSETLALVKPTAVLLNTSRGTAIDEEALFQALKAKRIAGAGLDVFAEEPMPSGHPFATLGNVVLTPHVAGHSHEAWFRRIEFAWKNIQRVASGGAPESVVGPPG